MSGKLVYNNILFVDHNYNLFVLYTYIQNDYQIGLFILSARLLKGDNYFNNLLQSIYTTNTHRTSWDGSLAEQASEALLAPGGLIVAATKVGYVLMATDGEGLERKFSAKQRNRNKPGVVLCASIDQLADIAQLNDEILEFYKLHWDQDILLGCILPWQKQGLDLIPDDGTRKLVMDDRRTSCFVIRYGRPAEQLVETLATSGVKSSCLETRASSRAIFPPLEYRRLLVRWNYNRPTS